jgi:hypothetical protein
MDNIAIAFLDIATLAHDWADDIAGERGVDYDRVRAWHGPRNVYFRLALEELQWQAGADDRAPVPDDYEIEF